MSKTGDETVFDIAIIGGGINGCGIARDAAGRGLSVYLCEKSDLASGTSSSSTKLIHGGLRYLEYFEFRLVRESLQEREVLWKIAPHIVRPMRFVLPHHSKLRPAWLLRLGLFLYDNLGGRVLLPPAETLDLQTNAAGGPLKGGLFKKGFAYSDCWVDDARLVVLNAMDAARHGAVVETRTALVAAERADGVWSATVEDQRSKQRKTIKSRLLINASGPWAGDLLGSKIASHTVARTRLVQGSHIVVPKLFDHDYSYIFQNADKRIMFAIPYENDYTLIGTTDQDYQRNPAEVAITPAEVSYLCSGASEYFEKPITPDMIVWTYSGVRALFEDGASDAQAATRDYVLDLDAPEGEPVLLSIFGGKITTYRRLAEHVMEQLRPHLPERSGKSSGWTGREALPGGGFECTAFAKTLADLKRAYPFLEDSTAIRMLRCYGLKTYDILGDAKQASDLGRDFGSGLSEAEVTYLRDNEWAESGEDVLWRRGKAGLRMTVEERRAVADYIEGVGAAPESWPPVATVQTVSD